MLDDQIHTAALRLGSATLYEAAKIRSVSVDPAIRPVWPGAAVAGPAYPVACAPGDNLSIQIALERAPSGSVLVVDAQGFLAGYWGEVLTVYARTRGIAGLVIDGGVRDTAALESDRFPVFARGVSVRGTLKAAAPGVGMPIQLGHTEVAAGDLVVADADGVVVLPAAMAPDILAKGQARFEAEEVVMAKLRGGATMLDLMGLANWRDRV